MEADMSRTNVVITNGKVNWDGVCFQGGPAKVYKAFHLAADAINKYYLNEWPDTVAACLPFPKDADRIIFNFMNEEEVASGIENGFLIQEK